MKKRKDKFVNSSKPFIQGGKLLALTGTALVILAESGITIGASLIASGIFMNATGKIIRKFNLSQKASNDNIFKSKKDISRKAK